MKLGNPALWRRLSVIGGSLFVVIAGGRDIAFSQEAAINNVLKPQTTKVIETGSGSGDYTYFKSDYSTEEALKSYCDKKGREIEGEGLVLLKNDNNALPLAKSAKVSLLGQGATATNYSTSGSSSASGVTYPTMEKVFSEAGLSVNPTTLAFYQSGAGAAYGRTSKNLIRLVNECPWSQYDDETKNSLSAYGDAAIVTFCRDSGEGSDISNSGSDGEDGSYLSLSKEESDLLTQLALLKAKGTIKKIIVLLNMAVPMETDFLFRNALGVDACLWIGNVGSQGLYGVGDVLTGAVTPSGKLDDTFLRDNFSSPAMAEWMANPNAKFSQKFTNYKAYNLNTTQSYYAVYSEGVYVGYRYYETRYEDSVLSANHVGSFDYSSVVAYPFGYGLSYTNFHYSDFGVKEEGENYLVNVKVTNAGATYSGKEVVEIYLQKPYTAYDKENLVEKPAVELVGYAKTKSLAPGASEEMSVTISKESFKSYDANGAKTYILDSGDYYLTAASSSHDAINNILAKQGYSTAKGMDKEGNATLASIALSQKELDKITYASSKETGKAITNQLDMMDVNRYANKGTNAVTYLTRQNWEGSFPTSAVSLSVSGDAMAADLGSNKPLPTNSGDTMPSYGVDSGLSLIALRSTAETKVSYDDALWDKLLNQMSYEDQSLLLTSAGFATVSITSVSKPATKDNDGPTGLVGTKTGTVMPSLGIWAASFNKDLVQEVGDALAEDARYAGYQSLYAPGINIHRTPFGGRLNEYFSEDPYLTGAACSAFVTGMQKKGVIPTIKHFAFNNEETNRNGVGIWMNEQEAREIMLKPFELALRPSLGNGHAIMTSFNRAGCIWVSASDNLLININRNEWGFDGYSLTDMASSNGASYMTYVDGFANGTDLFLGSGSTTALADYKSSAYFAKRMRDAAHHVLYTICNYSAAMNGISSSTKVISITPWWKNLLTGLFIGSGCVFGALVVMTSLSYLLPKKKESNP